MMRAGINVREPAVHRVAWVVLLAATLLGAATVAAHPVTASGKAAFQIVDVTHSPQGAIVASITSDGSDLDLRRLTALIDGVPATVRSFDATRRPPASVVVAIDTSGSMEGAPLLAAQRAALSFVDRLAPEDRIAVVTFAQWPVTQAEFSTERWLTESVLSYLWAGGETALYDAVQQSALLLGGEPQSSSRVLVLLSDGQDSGSTGATLEDTLSGVAAAGVTAHTFALGVDADQAYLRQLADASGGTFAEVADEAALQTLFDALGARLGATARVEVAAPPLTLGDHALVLRTEMDGEAVTVASDFNVDNLGLVTPRVVPGGSPDVLAIDVDSAVASGVLKLAAEVAGARLAPSQGGQFLLDAWLYPPGPLEVAIRAQLGGQDASVSTLLIDVPELAPELRVTVSGEPGAETLTARARAQDATATSLVAMAGGEVLAEGAGGALEVAVPMGTAITVELRDQRGQPIAAEVVRSARVVPSEGNATAVYGGAALAAVAVLGGALLVRRRRNGRREQLTVSRLRRLRPDQPPVAPPAALGELVLREPDGAEQSLPIGPKPVTIGSAPSCDLVLDGASIRPVHARVSARRHGEFQIHGLEMKGARPYNGRVQDEWVMVQSGESIVLGDHVIMLRAPNGGE